MNQTKTYTGGKLLVTATFYPLGEFARQIGGSLIELNTTVPAGVEPHDYEPTIQQTAQIYKSAVFIYNGAGLDKWAEKLAANLGQTTVVRATDETTDPHTWLDPILAASETGRINLALQKVDPTHAKIYAANTKKYQAELSWLDRQFKMSLSNCKRREIITSHQAFAYLAKRYNLKVYSISGVTPEEEPSPGKMAEIANLVEQTGIKYIFFETLSSPKIALSIARETGAKTLVFNPLEGLTEAQMTAGEDYISVQQMNLNNLKIALECQ